MGIGLISYSMLVDVRFNLMRCRFKAFSVSRLAGWLERPSVHRHIAMELMLTRSLAGARMALQNQLWWRLGMKRVQRTLPSDVMSLLTRQEHGNLHVQHEENQIVYSQGDPEREFGPVHGAG